MLLRKCASRLLPRAAAPSRGAPRGLLLRALSTASDAPKADDASPPEPPPEPPPPSAAPKGAASTMEFQAETKKLLDIVANSLYTDKEVFVRELVSNASDALEKRRHAALTSEGAEAEAGEAAAGEMQIRVTTDADANTLTIEDSGIGMTRDELIANLGTIARSGSRNFLQSLEGGQAAATNVIGQFGVGFYSVFMVADRVTVYSRRVGADDAYCWRSSGDGAYELSEAENVAPGTKIVIELKADEKSFASRFAIEQNIRKYSNFVGFPIYVDDERVNTVEALWTKSKGEVSQE